MGVQIRLYDYFICWLAFIKIINGPIDIRRFVEFIDKSGFGLSLGEEDGKCILKDLHMLIS